MSDAPIPSELFALHLLGALDGPEAAAVAARYAARAASDLAAILEAEALVGVVAHAAPPVAPPARARDRLLASIGSRAGTDPDATGGSRSRRAPPAGAARRRRWLVPTLVGAVLAAVAAFVFLRPAPNPPSPGGDADLVAVTRDSTTPRWILADARDATRPPLGTVFDDRARHRLVVATPKLASPGVGRTYVLWTIGKEAGAAPKNVGAIALAGDGSAVWAVGDAPAFADLAAVAISIEVDPHAAAPTAAQIVALASAKGG